MILSHLCMQWSSVNDITNFKTNFIIEFSFFRKILKEIIKLITYIITKLLKLFNNVQHKLNDKNDRIQKQTQKKKTQS